MKRVLVTGASGFVGGRLCECLHYRGEVTLRVLLRRYMGAARIARLPIEIAPYRHKDDIRRSVEGCEHVFHCAYDGASPERNVQLTTDLIEQAAEAGVRSFVYLSSLAAYYPNDATVVTEETDWLPTSWAYAREKRVLTELVLEAGDRLGLQVTVLEPPCVYGPFSKPFALMPVIELRTRRVVVPPDDEGCCNLLHVDDLVAAIVSAAHSERAAGERMIVTGPETISWRSFYEDIAGMIGGGTIIEMSASELDTWTPDHPVPAARRLFRDPRWLFSTTAGEPLRRAARRLLGETMSQRAKEYVPKPLLIPATGDRMFRWNRAQARCDKARDILGFEPRVGVAQGLAQLAEFVAWARI